MSRTARARTRIAVDSFGPGAAGPPPRHVLPGLPFLHDEHRAEPRRDRLHRHVTRCRRPTWEQCRGAGSAGAAGSPARRTTGDDSPPDLAAEVPIAHRSVVLRRSLRTAGRRGERRDGGTAAPAHRAADGELAVHRRDRAPGQRRLTRDGPARRAQPHDGRARHRSLRGVHARHLGAARCAAVDRAARCGPLHSAALGHLVPPTAHANGHALPGIAVRVFLGSWLGSTSPATAFSPILGAELIVQPGFSAELPLEIDFEHGLLVDSGDATVCGVPVPAASMGYLPVSYTHLTLPTKRIV